MKKIISAIIIIAFISGCKKTDSSLQTKDENFVSLAKNTGGSNLIVTTTSVYVGSAIGASANGNISSSGGGSTVSERGFCYHTSPSPTIANDTARAGSGSGNFQRGLVNLTPGTTYYVKAYAIRNGSVQYGNELSFTTLSLGLPTPGVGTVYDIDGNSYNTIKLGTQTWMVENLKTTHYRDGSIIPNIPDASDWTNTTTGAYCDYDNNPSNVPEYGRLYNLVAMKDPRQIAPAGWHVPSFGEWITALNFLGGGLVAGGRMKETGFSHWLSPNTGADNSSGFTAAGSGMRRGFSSDGTFFGLKDRCMFWSSSSSYNNSSPSFPFINTINLYYNSSSYLYTQGNIQGGLAFGFSIRCIKD
jgi:uncharacterized protein (TIGR02145 family)